MMKSQALYFLPLIATLLMAVFSPSGLAQMAPEEAGQHQIPSPPGGIPLLPPYNIPGVPWIPGFPGFPPYRIPEIPGFPGFPPMTGSGCWSALKGMESCIWQIYSIIYGGDISKSGEECCKAFVTITDECWAKMFPFQVPIGALVKDKCSAVGGKP